MNTYIRKRGIISTGLTVLLFVSAVLGLAMSFRIVSTPVNQAPQAGSCGCNPPPDTHGWTDNFCFHPHNTTGCPMTFPGGYCNPDGQGGYEDADWVRGYNEYHAQCGGTTNTPTPTRTLVPTNTPGPNATPTWTLVPTNTPGAGGGSCSCSPPANASGATDNFCFHPHNTPNCPMTNPGGYCNPDGKNGYEDADWTRGYNEYRAQCASGTQPTTNPNPTNTGPTPSFQQCVQACVIGGGLVPDCNAICATPSPTWTLVGTNTPVPTRQPTATPGPKCCYSNADCALNFECRQYPGCIGGLACLPAAGTTGAPTATPRPNATRTPTPTNTPPPTPTPTPILCQIIQENSPDHTKKYDLILIPNGYDSLTTFGNDAREAIAEFQNTNLGSLLNKFNFYYYNSLSIPLNVVPICRDGLPCWDKTSANIAKRQCHGDGYVIISYMTKKSENATKFESEWKSWNHIMGFGTGYGTGEALVLRAFLYQTPHELGHVIGQAGDAYDKLVTVSADMTSPWYNCSEKYSGSPTAACPKWQADGIAAGCYKGCSASNWYSPSVKSYMDLILLGDKSNFYDIPTKRLWEKSLEGFPN